MKFCSNCGAQLEDSVSFCAACGAAQAAPAPAAETAVPAVEAAPVAVAEPLVQEAPVETPKKKKSKLPLIIVLIVAVLAIAGGVVAGFMTDWFGLASPKEEVQEEMTYSDLATAAKATFGAGSLTVDTEVAETHGAASVAHGGMNVRFVFDRDDMLNSTVLLQGETTKQLLVNGIAYTYNYGEYRKQENDVDIAWFTPALDGMFGEKDIDWNVLMDVVTGVVYEPYSFSSDEFEAACDACRNGEMKLVVKGSNFTYTSEDKSVAVVFTVKNDLLTKVVFKMKNEDDETRLIATFSDVNGTTIPEEEINSFVAEVESCYVPTCDMCGDSDATYEKSGYNLCYYCNDLYDECSGCGSFTTLTDGKCNECLVAAMSTCMRCHTTENVTSLYQYKSQTTYYFCADCHEVMICCPFCFTYYVETEKCMCDGGVGYRKCQTCGEVTAVRQVDGAAMCDDCNGGFVPDADVLFCDMCNEVEATREYRDHNLCEDCYWDCDLCINCGNFNYLNDDDFCADCSGENDGDVVRGTCDMCLESGEIQTYEEYNLCETCYWACDVCEGCSEFTYVHYLEETAWCHDCSPKDELPQGNCAMCGAIPSSVENGHSLCYDCYWDYHWCGECDTYAEMVSSNENGPLCADCAG